MKNILTAIVLGIALAGASFAQNSFKSGPRAGGSGKTKIAVVEFSPGSNASVMDHEAKRQLQAFVASRIAKTHKFDVADVRNTRSASQSDLGSLNGGSTSAAVKLGKQLNVSYVLTGTVAVYDAKSGQVTLKARLVEVATGRIKYSGQANGQSRTPMRSGGTAEMMSKAVAPAADELASALVGM